MASRGFFGDLFNALKELPGDIVDSLVADESGKPAAQAAAKTLERNRQREASAPVNWGARLDESELQALDTWRERNRAQEAEAEQKERERILKEQQEELIRHTNNIQAYMFGKIKDINNFYRNRPADFKENIHRLDDTIGEGSYLNLITDVGGSNGGIEAFVHATPAQLAFLQPLLRFFIVDQSGAEQEIYFSDHFSEEHFKDIANKRTTGDIYEALKPSTRKGADVGIRSFSWNYFNKHEGDYIIEANMQLYFGTLAELVNAEYLQFLFPTGTAKELASDLGSGLGDVASAERSRGRKRAINRQEEARKELQARIDNHTKLLGRLVPDSEKVAQLIESDKARERKKEFRQLKVVVGWNAPAGNEAELRKLFPKERGPGSYESFRNGLFATQTVIFLNLVDYNVQFQQEGPTTLDLSYVGSSDNYMATAGSDVFGSVDIDSLDKKFMFEETQVSIENFINIAGQLFDTNKKSIQSAAEESKAVSSGDEKKSSFRLGSIKRSGDPYLLACAQKYGIEPNQFGEKTITVTLAGLKKAQELISLRLKLAELTNVDENARHVEKARQVGQLITLLYDRAYDIRLRDIYSNFLEGFIDDESEFVKKATIISQGENAPARIVFEELSEEDKAILKSDPKRKLEDDVRKAFNGLGPDLPPPPGHVTVYFMRFGDILRKGMKDSNLREDISLILGNAAQLDGPNYSIYDIPITMDTFGQFFYDRVVSRRLKVYPFRYFLNDMLKVVARFINQSDLVYDRMAFDYSVLSGLSDDVKGLPFVLNKSGGLEVIRDSQVDPLSKKGKKFQHFYPIYSANTSMRDRTGDRLADEREGIMHYVIGSDRGLAKEFNFSRQDVQYFQEMLIESNNLDDKIQALFLPQNVSIRMFGNSLHRNGDLIFVDSRPSLGGFAGPVLGIGGYYRVISSTHTISNRGYETELNCVFELRVTPKRGT